MSNVKKILFQPYLEWSSHFTNILLTTRGWDIVYTFFHFWVMASFSWSSIFLRVIGGEKDNSILLFFRILVIFSVVPLMYRRFMFLPSSLSLFLIHNPLMTFKMTILNYFFFYPFILNTFCMCTKGLSHHIHKGNIPRIFVLWTRYGTIHFEVWHRDCSYRLHYIAP